MSNHHTSPARQSITRRRFLLCAGVGAAALTISACGAGRLTSAPVTPAALAEATSTAAPESPIATLHFRLTARETALPVLPGPVTQVMSYAGEVLAGDPAAVTALPGSYVGPVLRVRRGQRVRVQVRNELAEPTNVHWHGLVVPAEVDGQPGNPIDAGAEAVYEFEVRNRPGTYWFHPHPHGRTAEQAYRGLAGLLIVADEQEEALGLPAGDYDVPLVIQDRRFDDANQLTYVPAGMAGMSDQMMGLLGDRILVNGQPDVVLPVAARPYRLRLLNGSNARIYKLAWEDGAAMTVLASDGGLLDAPAGVPYVMLSPGERVELWADFGRLKVGEQVKLVSQAYEGVEAGAMGMRMGEPALPNGAPFEVMTFAVDRQVEHAAQLPTSLLSVEPLAVAAASNRHEPRQFVFAMDDQMNWTINGRQFEMDVVADDERVRFGDTEVWELINAQDAPAAATGGRAAGMNHGAHAKHGSGGMAGMKDFMAHPVHLHGVQFQVVERQVDAAQRPGWETVQEGLLDLGWKDTVLVMPGERVRILVRFEGYRGVYLIHCHNLEHEDSGMMRHFEVV